MLIYPAVTYKKVELLRHLVHLVQTCPKGFAQLRGKGLWQANIDSRFPKSFASALIPDLLCFSTQEASAGQGGGGKIGKK